MGGSSSVELITNAPSRAWPGLKVVATPELDEHMDYPRFWSAFVTTLKEDYNRIDNFVSGERTDYGENQFHIVVTIAGSSQGLPIDPTIRIIYFLDEAKSEIYEELRDNSNDALICCGCYKVLQDPLQLEFFRQNVIPIPRSGVLVAATLKEALTHVVGREVTTQPDMDSTVVPGAKSVWSESLEDVIEKDKLWDEFIALIKSQSINPYKTGDTEVVETFSSPETQMYAWNVFCPVDGPRMVADKVLPNLPPGGEVTAKYMIRANKLAYGFTYQHQRANDHLLFMVTTYFVLSNPLRVEAFAVYAGPQLGDEKVAKEIQNTIDLALARGKDTAQSS